MPTSSSASTSTTINRINTTDSDESTLQQLYNQAEQLYTTLTDNPPADATLHQQLYDKLQQQCASIQHTINQQQLVSSSDEWQDITTNVLFYITAPYMSGNLFMTTSIPSSTSNTTDFVANRYKQLLQGLQQLQHYMHYVELTKLCEQQAEDKAVLRQYKQYKQLIDNLIRSRQTNTSTASSTIQVPIITREHKIQQYQQERALQQQLQYITEQRQKLVAGNIDDEVERKYILLRHRQYMTSTVQHLHSALQELQLLRYKQQYDEIQQLEDDMLNASLDTTSNDRSQRRDTGGRTTIGEQAGAIDGSSPPTSGSNSLAQSVYRIGSPADLNKPIPQNMQKYLAHVARPQQQQAAAPVPQSAVRPTTTNSIVKSGLSDLDRRQNIMQSAFTDRNPYTLTPEQWAEQQIASGNLSGPVEDHSKPVDGKYVRQTSAAAAAAEINADSDEDVNELDDRAHDAKTAKDRAWDDWKDDHEKGAGARKVKGR